MHLGSIYGIRASNSLSQRCYQLYMVSFGWVFCEVFVNLTACLEFDFLWSCELLALNVLASHFGCFFMNYVHILSSLSFSQKVARVNFAYYVRSGGPSGNDCCRHYFVYLIMVSFLLS